MQNLQLWKLLSIHILIVLSLTIANLNWPFKKVSEVRVVRGMEQNPCAGGLQGFCLYNIHTMQYGQQVPPRNPKGAIKVDTLSRGNYVCYLEERHLMGKYERKTSIARFMIKDSQPPKCYPTV